MRIFGTNLIRDSIWDKTKKKHKKTVKQTTLIK